MTTHSSILAWEIPWTWGLGRPRSMGLLRGEHAWRLAGLSSALAFPLDGEAAAARHHIEGQPGGIGHAQVFRRGQFWRGTRRPGL